MINGASILKLLVEKGYDCEFEWNERSFLSDFEKLVSVILTQNTKWQNVLKSLVVLRNNNITTLDKLAEVDVKELAIFIKNSGFYNTKAKRLHDLAKKIIVDFGTLDEFLLNVSRDWLLSCKGISFESADSILNYLCKKEYLVVDSYTIRFLNHLGYEFNSYDEVAEFLMNGLDDDYLYKKLQCDELYQIYAKFHSILLNFCKTHFNGNKLDNIGKEILEELI